MTIGKKTSLTQAACISSLTYLIRDQSIRWVHLEHFFLSYFFAELQLYFSWKNNFENEEQVKIINANSMYDFR